MKKINDPNSDIYRQCQEAEVYNQTLPKEIRYGSYTLHPQAFLTSKLINTKEITQSLQTTDYSKSLIMNFGEPKVEDKQTELKQSVSITENQPENQQSLELLEENKVLKERIKQLEQDLQSRDNKIKELKEQNQQLQNQIEVPPK
jgi:hypothetical protein